MNAQLNEPVTHNPAIALADRFAGQLLRASLDALANQRTLWPITPQQQQQEVIDRLRNAFVDIIRRQMYAVAAAGLPSSEVALQTITAKGETIKAVVTIGDNKTLHDLVDAIGRKVVLVLVDAEAYTAGMDSFEAQKDQPELPLEHVEGQSADADAGPPRCTCTLASDDRSVPHEPDCELLRRPVIDPDDPAADLQRFQEGAVRNAAEFKSLAERGVIDGRSERVKHQDQNQGRLEAPKFPKPDDGNPEAA